MMKHTILDFCVSATWIKIENNYYQVQEITALYVAFILFIQYPTHFEMPVPLYEYISIIHCLFHD